MHNRATTLGGGLDVTNTETATLWADTFQNNTAGVSNIWGAAATGDGGGSDSDGGSSSSSSSSSDNGSDGGASGSSGSGDGADQQSGQSYGGAVHARASQLYIQGEGWLVGWLVGDSMCRAPEVRSLGVLTLSAVCDICWARLHLFSYLGR